MKICLYASPTIFHLSEIAQGPTYPKQIFQQEVLTSYHDRTFAMFVSDSQELRVDARS